MRKSQSGFVVLGGISFLYGAALVAAAVLFKQSAQVETQGSFSEKSAIQVSEASR